MTRSYYTRKPNGTLTIVSDTLKKVCCEVLDINQTDAFYTKSRLGLAVKSRQIYCYLIHEYLKKIGSTVTLAEIGTMTYTNGDISLDHATVMHSIKTISDRMPFDKELKYLVELIRAKFNRRIDLLKQNKGMYAHYQIMNERTKLRFKQRNLILQ